MKEIPIALQQLIVTTASELGLGIGDRIKVETALTKAFTIGMKYGAEVVEDEYHKNSRTGRDE